MVVNLELAPAERAPLESLLQLYVHDLSALIALDIGDDGRFPAPPVDPWFSDRRNHAFLIRANGKLAGFALVQQHSYLNGDESITDLAEFFVLRKCRGQKIGERAAAMLFDRYPGAWEVRQKIQNQPATAFWRRAIGRYTGGSARSNLRQLARADCDYFEPGIFKSSGRAEREAAPNEPRARAHREQYSGESTVYLMRA